MSFFAKKTLKCCKCSDKDITYCVKCVTLTLDLYAKKPCLIIIG